MDNTLASPHEQIFCDKSSVTISIRSCTWENLPECYVTNAFAEKVVPLSLRGKQNCHVRKFSPCARLATENVRNIQRLAVVSKPPLITAKMAASTPPWPDHAPCLRYAKSFLAHRQTSFQQSICCREYTRKYPCHGKPVTENLLEYVIPCAPWDQDVSSFVSFYCNDVFTSYLVIILQLILVSLEKETKRNVK